MVGVPFNREGWRPLYPFESQTLHLQDGSCMHYLDEGQGEPIVCVHGNPTWSFYYRELIKANRAKHRVIVPDHIGCGLSDKPQKYNYTLEQHIANFTELMDTLNPEPFTLVVHDWGGPIGLGYAVRHPEKVKRILVLNTAAFHSKYMPALIALARIPLLGDFLIRYLNAFVLGSLFLNTKRPLGTCVAAGYLYPYSSRSQRIAVARFVKDIPQRPQDPSYATLSAIEEKLELLQDKPMSIVWGALDPVFNDRFLQEWRRRFPQAEVNRLEDAGHWIMEDASMRVQESLEALLSRA